MIWLAAAGAMCCAAVLVLHAQAWFAPALRRYRELYTQDAGVRLSEVFLFIDPSQLWLAAVACAALSAALAFSLTGSGILAALLAGLASRAPRMTVEMLRRRRARRFEQQLPMALLMLASALRAGVALPTGLRHVVEQSDAPLAQEFGLMLREQRLGVPWDAALGNLQSRMPADSTSLVVAAMRIAAQTGGNLAEALGNLSTVLRARRLMGEKIKALSSEAISSAGIIGSLPIVVMVLVFLSTPSYILLLFTEPRGQFMLLVAAFWMATGVFMMKRMISFKF